MDERKKAEVKLAEERMAAEEEQKRIEMEEFQKKYGTKKPKERKQRQTSVEENRNWLRISGIAAMVLIPVVGVVYYLVMGQWKESVSLLSNAGQIKSISLFLLFVWYFQFGEGTWFLLAMNRSKHYQSRTSNNAHDPNVLGSITRIYDGIIKNIISMLSIALTHL